MFPKINLFKGYVFMTYMEPKCIHFYNMKIPTLEFVLPSRQLHNYNNMIMIFINKNYAFWLFRFKGGRWYWNDLVMIILQYFPLSTGSTRSQLNDFNKIRMPHAKHRLQSTNALKEIAIESSAKSEIQHRNVVILTVVI